MMYYRVFESGGKQYRAAAGDLIKVEKLDAREGTEIVFDKVLFAADGEKKEGNPPKFGVPYIQKEQVRAVVVRHAKDPKIKIIKFKRRKHSLKWQGHRQWFTEVLILAPGEKVDSKKVAAIKLARSVPKPILAKPKKVKVRRSGSDVASKASMKAPPTPTPTKDSAAKGATPTSPTAPTDSKQDKTADESKPQDQAATPAGTQQPPTTGKVEPGRPGKQFSGRKPGRSFFGNFMGKRGGGDRSGNK